MRGAFIGLIATLLLTDFAAAANAATRPSGDHVNPIIPLVDFRETTFEQAVDALREMSKANVIVRWQELEDAGVSRTARVEIRPLGDGTTVG